MRTTILSLLLILLATPLMAAETPRCLQLSAGGQFVPRPCAAHDSAKLASFGEPAAKELESPISFKFFGVGNIPSGVPVEEADPNMQYAALFDSDPSPNPGCSSFDRAFIAISGSFGAAPAPAKGTINYTPGGFGCGLYVQSGCFDYVQSPDDACFSFVTGGRSQLLIQGKPPFSAAFDDIGLGTQFAASVMYSDGANEVAADLCTGLEGISVGEVTRSCGVGDVNLQSPIAPALEDAVDLARLEFDFGEFMGGPSEVDVSFTVAPNPVEVGQMFTLNWSAPMALTGASCLAGLGSPTAWSTLGFVENLGSISYPAPTEPGTYFFALTCEGPNNGFGSVGLELEVIASSTPSALNLDVFPAATAPSAVVTLSWSATQVNSGTPCMPGPNWPVSGPLAPSGSVSFAAPAVPNVEYTLSCDTSSGPLEQTVQLQLAAQPPLPAASASILVSRKRDGSAAGNAPSSKPSVTDRGELVAYISQASDLTQSAISGQHTYVHETMSGSIGEFSVDVQGNLLPFASEQAALAGSAFTDTEDILAFATSDGQVRATDFASASRPRPISTASGGALGNGITTQVSLSDDGESAVFTSDATNLVPNGPSGSNIYLKRGDSVELISRPASGFADGASHSPAISGDGSIVAFATDANNLGLPAPQGTVPTQICLAGPLGPSGRPRLCVSYNFTTGLPANAPAGGVQLSADGRQGVFESAASNLVVADGNQDSDIFWFSWDGQRPTGLVRVSTAANGDPGNGPSYGASISADGDTISFISEADNLVLGDTNGVADVFLKHVRSGQIVMLGRATDGAQANAASANADLSGSGNMLVYESLANNLSNLDQNDYADVYRVAPPLVFDRNEPRLQQVPLPAPQLPNPSCPAGYFVALVEDGPRTGIQPGIFGLELLLNSPGARRLSGGLSFGGLVDAGQAGFAGVSIANPGAEAQRLNVRLNGIPLSGPTSGTYPVRVSIKTRQDDGTRQAVLQLNGEIGLEQTLTGSIEVAPGFYLITVEALNGDPGGDAEGVFFLTLSSQFLDRPGGGFQGGAVIGGYHAENALGAASGFAAFCVADPYSVSARVLSAPSYGSTGAGDLRFKLLDQSRQSIYEVPSY